MPEKSPMMIDAPGKTLDLDKESIRYHCEMIQVYLDAVRSGQNKLDRIGYHIHQIDRLFREAAKC